VRITSRPTRPLTDEEKQTLRDGGTLTVPMTLMDSAFDGRGRLRDGRRADLDAFDAMAERIANAVQAPTRRELLPTLDALMDSSTPEHRV